MSRAHLASLSRAKPRRPGNFLVTAFVVLLSLSAPAWSYYWGFGEGPGSCRSYSTNPGTIAAQIGACINSGYASIGVIWKGWRIWSNTDGAAVGQGYMYLADSTGIINVTLYPWCNNGTNLFDLNGGGTGGFKTCPEYGKNRCPYGSYFDTATQTCKPEVPVPNASPLPCESGPSSSQSDDSVDEDDEGNNTTPPPACVSNPLTQGDPVNIARGYNLRSDTDIARAGVSRLAFVRYYDDASTGTSYDNLGPNWRDNYAYRLSALNGNYTAFMLYFPKGNAQKLVKLNGVWVDQSDPGARFTVTTSWAQYTSPQDVIYRFAPSGSQLRSIHYSDGEIITLHYIQPGMTGNPIDRLQRVVSNRSANPITLSYSTAGQIATVTGPNLAQVHYHYDKAGRLASVTYPQVAGADTSNPPTLTYQYDSPAGKDLLTGVTNELGVQVASWQYDSKGRVIEGAHANGVDQYRYSYGSGATVVTDPLGQPRTYHLTEIGGKDLVTGVSGTVCGHCNGGAASYSYGPQGLESQQTDHKGNVTRYTRNARGLIIESVAASGIPGVAQTQSTVWAPNFNKPTQVVSDGQSISMSYNSRGQLLSRTVGISTSP